MIEVKRGKELNIQERNLSFENIWYSQINFRLLRYKIRSSFFERRLQNMHYGFLLVGICNQYNEYWKKKRCRVPPPIISDYFKTSQIQNLVFFHPKMAYYSIIKLMSHRSGICVIYFLSFPQKTLSLEKLTI